MSDVSSLATGISYTFFLSYLRVLNHPKFNQPRDQKDGGPAAFSNAQLLI